MNTKKRIDGDYTIETINGGDRVIINTTAVAVTGNLEVSGNLTYINTEQLDVKDPFNVKILAEYNHYKPYLTILL